MKAVKILVIVLGVYVGTVVAFESLIGFFQPSNADTIVITTIAPDGSEHARVVSRLETDGKTYVAANHWPRAWYEDALEDPEVTITTADGKTSERIAVPVTGAEHDRVQSEHPHSLAFRFLTGFPPRYFLRLDPRQPATGPDPR